MKKSILFLLIMLIIPYAVFGAVQIPETTEILSGPEEIAAALLIALLGCLVVTWVIKITKWDMDRSYKKDRLNQTRDAEWVDRETDKQLRDLGYK